MPPFPFMLSTYLPLPDFATALAARGTKGRLMGIGGEWAAKREMLSYRVVNCPEIGQCESSQSRSRAIRVFILATEDSEEVFGVDVLNPAVAIFSRAVAWGEMVCIL